MKGYKYCTDCKALLTNTGRCYILEKRGKLTEVVCIRCVRANETRDLEAAVAKFNAKKREGGEK